MGENAGLRHIELILDQGEICLLDGANGTEIERRGYQTKLPLWTASAISDAPALLLDIHREYLIAGADIITANTFRTARHTMAKAGQTKLAREFTLRAVEIAREAVRSTGADAAIAGSVAPLEDCYRPDLVPPEATVIEEYSHQLELLEEAGVDLVIFETMINLAEVRSALTLVSERPLPFIMSFTAENGNLLDGTPLEEVVRLAAKSGPLAILLNCRTPEVITENLNILATAGLPFGAYGNGSGKAGGPTGWRWDHDGASDEAYLDEVGKWITAGARVIGGCCGTSPSTISRLNALRTSMRNL